MKASDLHQKSKEELNNTLLTLSQEMFNLKMQKGTGQLSKPDQMVKIRKDIARIHTVLNQKLGV
jgi:large subunit ribosomal protein L29